MKKNVTSGDFSSKKLTKSDENVKQRQSTIKVTHYHVWKCWNFKLEPPFRGNLPRHHIISEGHQHPRDETSSQYHTTSSWISCCHCVITRDDEAYSSTPETTTIAIHAHCHITYVITLLRSDLIKIDAGRDATSFSQPARLSGRIRKTERCVWEKCCHLENGRKNLRRPVSQSGRGFCKFLLTRFHRIRRRVGPLLWLWLLLQFFVFDLLIHSILRWHFSFTSRSFPITLLLLYVRRRWRGAADLGASVLCVRGSRSE